VLQAFREVSSSLAAPHSLRAPNLVRSGRSRPREIRRHLERPYSNGLSIYSESWMLSSGSTRSNAHAHIRLGA